MYHLAPKHIYVALRSFLKINKTKLKMPTVSIPDTTDPKTTCFPSKNGVCAVQMKNWDPFVLGPAFAIDNVPGSYKSFMLKIWHFKTF